MIVLAWQESLLRLTNGASFILVLKIFYFWMAMSLMLHSIVYIFLGKFVLLERLVKLLSDLNGRKNISTAKLLSKGTVIINYVKHFLNFIVVILNDFQIYR